MKIKKFNINILLSLFTLTKVYSMQEERSRYSEEEFEDIQEIYNSYKAIDFIQDSINKCLNEIFAKLKNNVKEKIFINIKIAIPNISTSHLLFQNLLESINYKKREENNKEIFIDIEICNNEQIKQYIIYHKLLFEYLKILKDIIFKITTFNNTINNNKEVNNKDNIFSEKKEMLEKEIKNVFQNPNINYDTLLKNNYPDNNTVHNRIIFNKYNKGNNHLNLDKDIETIKSEIEKLEIIEKNEILKEFSYDNKYSEEQKQAIQSIVDHYNQIEDDTPRDNLLQQILSILREKKDVTETLRIKILFKKYKILHLHPFFKNLLKSINYKEIEENNTEIFTNIVICNKKQIEQYTVFNKLLMEYLNILLDTILKIKNFNNTIKNDKNFSQEIINKKQTEQRIIIKTINSVFQNPKSNNVLKNPKLNYDSLLSPYYYNNNEIYDYIFLKIITEETNEDNKSLEEKIQIIKNEIEKMEKIKNIKMLQKFPKDDEIIPLPVNSMENQDEDYKQENIKEQKEKEEEITKRNKNKTPEKFPKERW